MKNNNALVRVGETIVPPPTKAQLMRATARALADDHAKQRAARVLAITAARKRRDEKMVKIAKAKFSEARVMIIDNTWSKSCTVEFAVEIPRDLVPEEEAELRSLRELSAKSERDFLKELREAEKGNESQAKDLLDDEEVRAKLLEAGKRILAGALAKPGAVTV